MPLKRKFQLTAVVFLIVAIFLLIPNTDWQKESSVLGFVSLIIATVGSIISVFIPSNFVYLFTKDSWKQNDSRDYSITVFAKEHGMGRSPQVRYFQKNETYYEEVGVAVSHNVVGDITIDASESFIGKVIITS